MLPLRDEMPRALFIPDLPERLAILLRFCVLFFPDVHERADLRPEADLGPENDFIEPERIIADLLNLPPLNLGPPPPLSLCMPPPLNLGPPPPLSLCMPPPPNLGPPPLNLGPPPPPRPPASATATEMVAATRAMAATDAIRFSFEFEGAMVRTAGTPLVKPLQNSRWRSNLFGALRRRTEHYPKK